MARTSSGLGCCYRLYVLLYSCLTPASAVCISHAVHPQHSSHQGSRAQKATWKNIVPAGLNNAFQTVSSSCSASSSHARQPSSRSSSTCLQTSFRTSPFRQSRFSSAKWLMAQDIHTTSVGFVDNCGTASGALRRNFPGLRLATRLPARISCIVEEWQPRLAPLIASLLLASSSFRVCRPENKSCRAFVSKWKPGKTDSHVPAFQHG